MRTRSPARAGRRLFALAAVLLCAIVFGVRLVDIQLVSAAELNEEAADRRAVPIVIPSIRGDIIDRNGQVLATTDERYDVQLSPKNTRLNDGKFWRLNSDGIGTTQVSSEQAFAEIGEVTGQTAEEITAIVDAALEANPNSDFAYVKRSVDLTTLNQLRQLSIPWLTFATNYSRSYPNGAVAGNIIGYSGTDNVPQAGVELSHDVCLTGVDGQESYERGADGVALPGSVVVTREAVDGGTVQLTIDLDLQYETQQIINQRVRDVAAEWGRIVVMNVETGELVAVAEDGSVDPNDIDASDPMKWAARSFVDPYEPGSTFKTVTTAALIDQGLADAHTQLLTPWTWQPESSVRFNDSFVHEPMQWTLAGIMAHSSNVGISMLGNQMSAETRYDYMRAFGLGTSTAAGMPLEDSGLLYPYEQWDRQTSYNVMFGQGLSTTIVQTAAIYQTVANGGLRVPPSVVSQCIDADGNATPIEHGEPVQVVSEQAAEETMRILETVVESSWIRDYVSIPGYRIAGKTGTAEQADGMGGYRADYVHSFVGAFPAEQPQFVVAISIAFPASSNDGSLASLGGFRDAAEATIRSFNIPPSTGVFEPIETTY